MKYTIRHAGSLALSICAGMATQVADLGAQESDGNAVSGTVEEIVVLGTPRDRYEAGRSDSLTGFSLDFLEMPRIVETIPEQLLLDQKVTELGEALRNVPGVMQSDGFGGTNDDFFLRGYRRNTVYRNGFRRRSNFRINTTNLERIEVVKGPASIGFGQVEPGGLVNVVTKRPLGEPRGYVELRGGRWDDYFVLLDISRPLGDFFSFRVNGSLHDAESFRDFAEIERDVLAATGRFQFTDATTLDVSVEYRDEARPLDRGTIAVPVPGGTRAIVDTPRSRRFGEPFESFETELEFYSIDLNHAFNDDWSLLASAAYETAESNDIQVRPRRILIFDQNAPIVNGFLTGPATPKNVNDDPTDRIFLVRRVDGSQDRKIIARFANIWLTGAFETGRVSHQVSFLADYREDDESRLFAIGATAAGVDLPLFDVNNPVYGTIDPILPGGVERSDNTNEYGFAVQDYIQFSERFAALVGGRIDVADADGSGPLEEESEFSPQAALLYSPTDSVSLFASYAESFIPNTQTVVDIDGNVSTSDPFPPEDSQQVELGVKTQFFDGRLNFSAAIYDISKENVVAGRGDEAMLIDGQDASGVELSAGGQPVPGMYLIAGYAYTDAELPDGNRPRNVAEHTANGWISYEFQRGGLAGLGLGAGVFYSGDRFGDDANTWELGSFTLIDASVWYNLPFSLGGRDESLPTRIQLSGKNLTDEVYYPASGFNGGQRINIGTPRSWFVSVTTRW